MNFKKPEECGISSANIEKFIRSIQDRNLFVHDVLIAKGDDIIFEKYWAPFDEKFLHRQYSVTKSIVALGVGFAEQDGLVDLDSPISRYFPEETANTKCEFLKNQTVREMLMMETSMINRHFIKKRCEDRVKFYFENDTLQNTRESGTVFKYDSEGSFVLGAMVERVTGKRFMEYMREKCFDKIGVSPEAYMLTCPGGHSWGDSALLCTARDLYLMARFTMNMGKWNGEQLLNEKFVKDATSKLVDNSINFRYEYNTLGYGYYIWRTYDNSFFFNGMGGQLAVCVPHKDLILIYNGDDQGDNNFNGKKNVIDAFFDLIVRGEQNIGNASAAQASLEEYTKDLKLAIPIGESHSPFQEKINEKTFTLEENPMNIKWLRFNFTDDVCTLDYENATGKKTIYFGMGKNVFDKFPEEGYSDLVAAQYAKGNYYKSATSAVWIEPQKLGVCVQAIDKYFGKLNMQFGFKNENTVGIKMTPQAECFFEEYDGYATGYVK
jgi:CubicO group peptidase (beta-lactamase class C family)